MDSSSSQELRGNEHQQQCYSIWIQPPEEPPHHHRSQLQSAIDKLSKRYNTTSFLPHVTVLGRLVCRDSAEALQKWQDVKRGLSSLDNKFIPCFFGSALHNVRWDEADRSNQEHPYPPGSILQVPDNEQYDSSGNGIPDQGGDASQSPMLLQWNQASVVVMKQSPELLSLVKMLRRVLFLESTVTGVSETKDGNDGCFAPRINEPHLSLVYADRIEAHKTKDGTGIISDASFISSCWPKHEFDATEISLVQIGFSGLSGIKHWKVIRTMSLAQPANDE